MEMRAKTVSLSKGFTLIELMIVVTIVGVISALALPSYFENVKHSRRSEARNAIGEIRNLELEFFQNYKRYGTLAEIGYTTPTPGGNYQLAIVATALTFSATATAIGNQAKDDDCAVFGVNVNGTLVSYNSASVQSSDCW